MILFGASGHAKVIVDILNEANDTVDYLVDANPAITELSGLPVIHESDFQQDDKSQLIISIGSNTIRKRLAVRLKGTFGRAVHPKVALGSHVTIGEGTVIMAGAVVNASSSIGAHCIINTSASIDHDCKIEDFVHVSPNATLCGTVTVGEGTQIGAGATVIPNLEIGKWATIGAGAVIIENIPDYAVVVGNPARIIKYNDKG